MAYWNEPLVEFYTTGINPNNKPSIKTFSGGERYLALGDYTRIRFFWKMKKASLSKLNAYDTRYATNVSQVFQTTYNNPGDPSYYMYYFGSSMFRSTSQATAYYDPRRNMRERLKLFTPSIPFYRRRDNNVYGAFDGAVSGSYTDEDIVDTHQMGFAYGNADSFWLPGNQIQ